MSVSCCACVVRFHPLSLPGWDPAAFSFLLADTWPHDTSACRGDACGCQRRLILAAPPPEWHAYSRTGGKQATAAEKKGEKIEGLAPLQFLVMVRDL